MTLLTLPQHIFSRIACTLFMLTSVSACSPTSLISNTASIGMQFTEERTPGTILDDATIKAKLTHRFIQTDVNDMLVNVSADVHEARVLLTGSVRKRETIIDAVKLAWDVSGVREVINEMTFTETSNPKQFAADMFIENAIRTKLLFGAKIRSRNYEVEVVDGTAYLFGIAQNEEEMLRTAEVARRVQGVTKVISHVRLKNSTLRHAPNKASKKKPL